MEIKSILHRFYGNFLKAHAARYECSISRLLNDDYNHDLFELKRKDVSPEVINHIFFLAKALEIATEGFLSSVLSFKHSSASPATLEARE
jgi:hypothetical protein